MFLRKNSKYKTNLNEDFIREKERLLSSKQYKLLEAFVKKCSLHPKFNKKWGIMNFGEEYYDEESGEAIDIVSNEEIETFTSLLNAKGFHFSTEQIKEILGEEVGKMSYNDFKVKMIANHPKKLNDFVGNLIDFYGDNYKTVKQDFEDLLKEKDIEYSEEGIDAIANEIKISQLEKNLNSKDKQYISMNAVDLMNGFDFERFLKMLFEKMGYIVKHTQLTGDQGADLVIEKFGKTAVVQAKRYNGSIGNKAVQEVVASIKHYKADSGMVVTNSSFTPSAVKLASSNKVDLVDRGKLVKLISEYL